MITTFAVVGDIDRFLDYLRTFGIEIEEISHVVLTDSSEFEIVICRREGVEIAYMALHYIDTHYAALSNLSPDASDREILEALYSVKKEKLWRIPVEPVIFVTNSYELLKIVSRYRDEVPDEGKSYLERYLASHPPKIIEASTMLSIARRLKDAEVSP